jgi:hypothetical protein
MGNNVEEVRKKLEIKAKNWSRILKQTPIAWKNSGDVRGNKISVFS